MVDDVMVYGRQVSTLSTQGTFHTSDTSILEGPQRTCIPRCPRKQEKARKPQNPDDPTIILLNPPLSAFPPRRPLAHELHP